MPSAHGRASCSKTIFVLKSLEPGLERECILTFRPKQIAFTCEDDRIAILVRGEQDLSFETFTDPGENGPVFSA